MADDEILTVAQVAAQFHVTPQTVRSWIESGKLKGGRHIRYANETPMTNLLLSMLDKAGVETEKLGDSTGKLQHLSDI